MLKQELTVQAAHPPPCQFQLQPCSRLVSPSLPHSPTYAGINLGISVPGKSKKVDAKFESDFLSAALTYGPKKRPT